MAFHGSNVQVLIDQFNMTPYFKEFNVESMVAMHDATVFGNTSRVKLPGLKDGKASGDGFFDQTVTVGSYPVLKGKYGSAPGSVNPAAIVQGPNGFAVGNRVVMGYFNETSLSDKIAFDDLVTIHFDSEAEEDAVDYGASLNPMVPLNTGVNLTGPAVDNLVQTTNGGVGQVHFTVFTGGAPGVASSIEHSTDNSVWVNLLTFAGATATGVQRVEVAPGTTIRRYTRAVVNFPGGVSAVTMPIFFARR